MKALVVYDSYFGNTEKVARAIGKALEAAFAVDVAKADALGENHLKGLQLLIVGSPTRAFTSTKIIKKFIKRLPSRSLSGVKVAAFDTRISLEDINSRVLNKLVKLFGYAAEPVATGLQKKGGEPVLAPEGFLVTDSEGPLKEGELPRAAEWVKPLLASKG